MDCQIKLSPTKYRVSTITAVGSVGTSVALDVFFERVPVPVPVPEEEEGGGGYYTYAEYARKHGDLMWRGVQSRTAKATAARRAAKSRMHADMLDMQTAGIMPSRPVPAFTGRHFDNQVTVVYKMNGNTINIKLFRNGKVQMTGIKAIEHGSAAIEHMVDMLRSMGSDVVGDMDSLVASGYRICLINSDFNLGFELRRVKLFQRIRTAYDIVSSFEPCIYPGVKLCYMWNVERDTADGLFADAPKGVCMCEVPCNGKGGGDGPGMCRKITVAVFQSGSVIITGAHTLQQVDDTYRFLVDDIMTKSYGEIVRVTPSPLSVV